MNKLSCVCETYVNNKFKTKNTLMTSISISISIYLHLSPSISIYLHLHLHLHLASRFIQCSFLLHHSSTQNTKENNVILSSSIFPHPSIANAIQPINPTIIFLVNINNNQTSLIPFLEKLILTWRIHVSKRPQTKVCACDQ